MERGAWWGSDERRARLDRAIDARRRGCVVVEDVHDPHNAAAVLRSCDAFGIGLVVFVFVESERFDPKRVGRTVASSANKWLDYEIHDSTEACLASLREREYTQIATVMEERADARLDSFDLRLVRPAIWLGNEHRGLSEAAIEGADVRLTIPMNGLVQSFNLSVSASLILWELMRQRERDGDGAERFGLTADEKEALRADFYRRAGGAL